MRRLRHVLLAIPLVTTTLFQDHPLVGQWRLRVPTGVRGADGSLAILMRTGTLAVETRGDSLHAAMTLDMIADLPSRTMRMSAPRRGSKVAFSNDSDAKLTNGSDERAVRAVSTYVVEAFGDSLAGVLTQEIPGISGVPARPFSGERIASPPVKTGYPLIRWSAGGM